MTAVGPKRVLGGPGIPTRRHRFDVSTYAAVEVTIPDTPTARAAMRERIRQVVESAARRTADDLNGPDAVKTAVAFVNVERLDRTRR